MDDPLASEICEPSTPCTFKDHAGFPQSNSGRTLRSDLTPEIYPLDLRAPFVFIQIWWKSGIQDEIQRSVALLLWSVLCPCFAFAAYSNPSINDKLTLLDNNLPTILCTISSELIGLALQHLPKILMVPIYYILPVLMPSSLLYLPSMTSMRYLLNIFQQSPPLALMETKAPEFFSPPLTSMSKKRHAPPQLL